MVAATILPFGVIIYRGRVELISGYYPNKVEDKEGIGRWVGSNLIFGGIYTLIFAILSNVVQILLIGIWMLGFTIIIARLTIGEKKYYAKK